MSTTYSKYMASRKFISGLILSALVATSFLIAPEPAASSTTVTFSVTVREGEGGPGIANQPVDFCHSGTGEWECASWNDREAITNGSGVASISVSLPNGTGFVQLSAGGYVESGTSYSKSWQRVDFVNGVANWEPVLVVQEADYIAVTVNVEDNLGAVMNEWVQVSKVMNFGQDSYTMTEWAVTNNLGNAVVYLDASLWLHDANENNPTEIVSAVGVEEWSNFDLTEEDVLISGLTGSSEIVVTSLLYSISGTIRAEVNGTLTPFANHDLCLFFVNQNTQKRTNIDFRTNESGQYSIEDLTERNFIQFQPHACRSYDEFATYDYQSMDQGDIVVVNGQAAVNVDFSAKGIRVEAKDENDNPAAYVQLRLDLQNPDHEGQYWYAVTDKDGFAYFGNLETGREYELSYRSSDMSWTTPMYQDAISPDIITNGASLTEVSMSLERISDFPETPVSISGKLVTRGDAPNFDPVPIANGTVNINASFGFGSNVSFRTRTDNDGNFSISGLPHGWIWLDVSAKGFRSLSKGFESTQGVNSYPQGNLSLRPSVSGDLQYGGILRDTEGNPVPNIPLILNHPYESGKEPQTETTDSQGRFLFNGLTSGHHWMYAETDWEDYEWSNWSFNLPVSKTNASLVIVERGLVNPEAQASVTGRVFEYLDVDGPAAAVGIQGLCVNVFPTEGGTVSVGTTDSSGNWQVTGLIDGSEYYIDTPKACPGDLSFVPFDFEDTYEQPWYEDSIVTARISGGTPHEWALKEISRSGPGSITGRVRDGEDYSNLAGVTIDIERAQGGIILEPVITDERGEYSFQGLPAGEYYVSVQSPVVGDQDYFDSWMSVEVTTEANRANVLLFKTSSFQGWEGVVSGQVLDENGDPHGNARIEIFNPDDYFFQQQGTTDNEGNFEISGLPEETNLFYKIIPWWKEIAIAIGDFIIGATGRNDLANPIELDLGSSISGQVKNIPQGVEVKKIHAELVDAVDGTFVHSAEVDLETGQYVIGQVPAGSYKVRFTQNANGSGWSEFAIDSVSMKPVYWNNSALGTPDIAAASIINVVAEVPVTSKDVTFSNGSIIQGSVSISTENGPIPLSGARSIWVDLFKKDSAGDWKYVTWSELSARSNYSFQFVGLAPGEYRIQFIDSRTGNNSLVMNFNGGAETLEEAPAIELGDAELLVANHSMAIAPPETSAEAFDLDSLTAAQLAELKDAISLEPESAPGSELEVFVGNEFAGNFVAAFANSTPVVLGDWKQVDSRGYIKVTIPTTLPAGSHRIGVLDSQGTVFGWAPISIKAPTVTIASPSETTKAKPKASKGVVDEEPEVEEKETSVTEEAPIAAPSVADSSSGDWLLPLAGGFLLIAAVGSVLALRSRRFGIRRR
jgi:hypothetical protein